MPYFWAGKTIKGFDCSGYTQFVHKMFEIRLRRDAWMKFEDGAFVTDDPLRGQPGDLMFFAESKEKITHVDFCLGQGKILHARGMVKINSMANGDPLTSGELISTFAGIKTFINLK